MLSQGSFCLISADQFSKSRVKIYPLGKAKKEKHTNKGPDTKNGRRDVAPRTYISPFFFVPIGSVLTRDQADYPIHSPESK